MKADDNSGRFLLFALRPVSRLTVGPSLVLFIDFKYKYYLFKTSHICEENGAFSIGTKNLEKGFSFNIFFKQNSIENKLPNGKL